MRRGGVGKSGQQLEKIPFKLSLSPVQSTTTNSPIEILLIAAETVLILVDSGTICANMSV